MIPNNITQEHVLKAMEEIKKSGVPEERKAVKFHLLYQGYNFPPKFVISIANKHANGVVLDSSAFSGGVETNSYLRKLGFEIIEEASELPIKVWMEKMYWKNREQILTGDLALGSSLISPQKDKGGSDIYSNMRKVKKGDIVLHLIDNSDIVGISKVKGAAEENNRLFFWFPPSDFQSVLCKCVIQLITTYFHQQEDLHPEIHP
jgi:hypothetical protein